MTEGGGRSKRSEAARKAAATKGPERLREAGLKSAAKGVEALREAARKGAAKRSPEQRREVALRAAQTRKRNKEAGGGAQGSQ
jgi:hypothetical protein